MCGIAGLIGNLPGDGDERLARMLEAQLHRGPDDSGLYRWGTNGGVRFGFRRLAILDLSLDGHQPMVDPESGNAIVFNGEIYNFAELRRELESEGMRFRSKGDTEVLLRAYGRFGPEVVHRLRGMFAFAIHDRQCGQVFLARDRLGIKPLYVAEVDVPGGKVLLFASEVRSLLASGLVERRLDQAALESFVWNGFVVGPGTIIRGVTQLGAGCTLTVPVGSLSCRSARYWSLGPRQSRPADEARATLESALTTAAKQHLVSDVPLGIFLSGGVDSSAVAALAARAGSGRIKTFHIGFDEAAFDESTYARAVANALHTEHAEFRLTQSVFIAQWEDALRSLDQPTFDAINTYFVSRVVREAGFKVALAGTGGDELFGGYSSFRNLPKAMRASRALRRIPASFLADSWQKAMRVRHGRRDDVLPQTRWAKLGVLLGTRGDAISGYQILYSLFTPDFVTELRAAGASSRTVFGLHREFRETLENAVAGLSPLAATSVLELALFLGERLLRDSDSASMATSIELRVPLLDHEVVEAVQRVPDALRFEPLGRKQLLRTLAMPSLDPAIFDRPKAGFVLPIAVWAKDQLAEDIEAAFSDSALTESAGLRSDTLLKLWRSFVSGAPGMYWSRVWAPYVLLNWCREHRVSL